MNTIKINKEKLLLALLDRTHASGAIYESFVAYDLETGGAKVCWEGDVPYKGWEKMSLMDFLVPENDYTHHDYQDMREEFARSAELNAQSLDWDNLSNELYEKWETWQENEYNPRIREWITENLLDEITINGNPIQVVYE